MYNKINKRKTQCRTKINKKIYLAKDKEVIQMTETRELNGEIESWAREPKEFGKNNRGSLGFKVDGEWHNIVGRLDELKELEPRFPQGTYVGFKETKNARGYWDLDGEPWITSKDGTTPKNSPIGMDKEQNCKTPTQGLITTDRNKDILFQVAFKGAIEISKKNTETNNTEKNIAWILDMTEKLYIGLNKTKLNLQEKSEW